MKRMAARERRQQSVSRVRYEFNVGFYSLPPERGATTGGKFMSAPWRRASKARIDLLQSLLTANAREDARTRNRLYLLSDLDVVPLRPYSALAEHFIAREQAEGGRDATARPEILFMRELPGSCGMTAWLANTGFMIMRNSHRIRNFWRWVSSTSRGKMYDQDIANFLLVRKLKPNEVPWGLLPQSLVGANASAVTAETAAFHAVGVSGGAKFDALERAWRSHPRASEMAGGAGFECAANESKVHTPFAWRATQRSFAPPATLVCE